VDDSALDEIHVVLLGPFQAPVEVRVRRVEGVRMKSDSHVASPASGWNSPSCPPHVRSGTYATTDPDAGAARSWRSRYRHKSGRAGSRPAAWTRTALRFLQIPNQFDNRRKRPIDRECPHLC